VKSNDEVVVSIPTSSTIFSITRNPLKNKSCHFVTRNTGSRNIAASNQYLPSPVLTSAAGVTKIDSWLGHCGRPRLDHALGESSCRRHQSPVVDEYAQWLNLVSLRCGKKACHHSLDESLTSFGAQRARSTPLPASLSRSWF